MKSSLTSKPYISQENAMLLHQVAAVVSRKNYRNQRSSIDSYMQQQATINKSELSKGEIRKANCHLNKT